MSPIIRRVVYVAIYEALAVVAVTLGFALLSGEAMALTTPLALACSLLAVAWNFAFNWGFEAWEARQTVKGRSLLRRFVHAAGFELGLTVVLVPLVAWWLGVTLLQALLFDAALIVFFLVYTFLFNLAFDMIFGLPESARG